MKRYDWLRRIGQLDPESDYTGIYRISVNHEFPSPTCSMCSGRSSRSRAAGSTSSAAANYYRRLGRHMGITGIPATYQEFAAQLDAYEAEHFAFDPPPAPSPTARWSCSRCSRPTTGRRPGSSGGSPTG
jgi:hypothetical protein